MRSRCSRVTGLTAIIAATQLVVQPAYAKPDCPPDSNAPVCNEGAADSLDLVMSNGGEVHQGAVRNFSIREVKTGNAKTRPLPLKVTTDAPKAKITAPAIVNATAKTISFLPTQGTPPGLYTITATAGELGAHAKVRVRHAIPIRVGGQKAPDGTWPIGTDPTPIDQSPCSRLVYHLDLQVLRPVTGPIQLSAEGLPAGTTATFSPATVQAPSGEGSVPATMTLHSTASATIATQTITIVASAAAAVGRERVTLSVEEGHVDAVTPATLSTPQANQPGSAVTITGQGFCPGSTVAFGNTKASVSPASIDPTGGSLTVTVPRNATGKSDLPVTNDSDGITVTSNGKALHSGPVFVDSWRNVHGFAFENSEAFQELVGGYSFDDLAEVFGREELILDIILDPVVVGGVLIPLAENIYGSGQCFGFTLSAINFMRKPSLLTGYPAWDGSNFDATSGGPARDAWHLRSPLTKVCENSSPLPSSCSSRSPKLSRYIHLQHVRQFSNQMADLLATQNGFANSAGFKAMALTALAHGDAMAILRDGSSGHVVPIIDVHDGPGGTTLIDTGDPNVPFGTGENAPNGVAHENVLRDTRIVVESNGDWKFVDNSGINMSSNKFDLFIARASRFATVDFPTSPTAGEALAHLIFGASGAQVKQITDASGHTMLLPNGKTNVDLNTRIPNSGIWPNLGGIRSPDQPPVFILPGNGAYTYQLDAAGPYVVRGATPMFGAIATVGAGAGGGDVVTFDTRGALDVRTNAAQRSFRGQLIVRHPDKSQRAVRVDSVVTRDGPSHLEFSADRSRVVYTHAAEAGTVKIELFTNKSKTSRLAAAPLAVEKGDVVTFTPNWATLEAGGGSVHVRKAAGTTMVRPIR